MNFVEEKLKFRMIVAVGTLWRSNDAVEDGIEADDDDTDDWRRK